MKRYRRQCIIGILVSGCMFVGGCALDDACETDHQYRLSDDEHAAITADPELFKLYDKDSKGKLNWCQEFDAKHCSTEVRNGISVYKNCFEALPLSTHAVVPNVSICLVRKREDTIFSAPRNNAARSITSSRILTISAVQFQSAYSILIRTAVNRAIVTRKMALQKTAATVTMSLEMPFVKPDHVQTVST